MFELNDQQQAAVAHRGGPLLVHAGAGTGKTGTLASRVADLITEGVPPGRICLLTFTRRAAQEMLARAGDLTAPAAAAQAWGGTFHSVAHRVLRIHGARLGLGPAFSVLDQGDAAEVMGLVRHDLLAGRGALQASRRTSEAALVPQSSAVAVDLGSGPSGRRFPRAATLASIYSRVVSMAEPLSEVVARDFPWCRDEVAGIGAIFEGYTARKRARRMLDFEDLLLAWRGLGATAGGHALLSGLWDHVLVDEYQDTNQLQADILALLRPDGVGLTAVGDDAQAIYAFRAATARNMSVFADRFPGTTIVRLEENYRSIPPILAVANAVMAAAAGPSVTEKLLWSRRSGSLRPLLRVCEDEAAQAEVVCDSVLRHREGGMMLRRQAVLFRASHHADGLELALARRNIPYIKYGGLRILEAAHVKDLLALLRVLDNPWDEIAWFRLLPLIEGVGPATARRVMAELGLGGSAITSQNTTAYGRKLTGNAEPEARGGIGWAPVDPAASPLARLLAAAPRVPEAAAPTMAALRLALADCADSCLPGGGTPAPGVQVERLTLWLQPALERRYGSAEARMADLAQLAQVASRYPDRGRFLVELTLDPPAATGDLAGPPLLDEDWLVLSTVHSAKGGEWDVVHLIHATDGMFPSDMACGDAESIEEERRLMYVAVTRARDVLEINLPQRYHVFREPFRRSSDRHLYAQASRFLTGEVRALMDQEHAGPPVPADEADAATARERSGMEAVDRFLSGLWA